MPNPKTIQKAKQYFDDTGIPCNSYLTDEIVINMISEFAEQHALENCTCKEDETTGAMEEWVCNNCGRAQK